MAEKSKGMLLALALIPAAVLAHGEGMEGGKPAPLVLDKAKLALVNEAYKRDVKAIVGEKCWNCHGDSVHYPWYYKIPGIKGMIDDDIKEAREHLNFAQDFPFASEDDPVKQIAHVESAARMGWMPPKLYKLAHPAHRITPGEAEIISNWAREARKTLGVQYFCPMHPDQVSEGPGKCPVCQMKLEARLIPQAAAERAPAKSPAKTAVKAAVYTCPMHPEVKSDKPGKCPVCKMDLEKRG